MAHAPVGVACVKRRVVGLVFPEIKKRRRVLIAYFHGEGLIEPLVVLFISGFIVFGGILVGIYIMLYRFLKNKD
ncbi:MAG: hypothetical protein AUG51_16715 [Acidobacteria bacterium 13_1_20CM_3_53_8]|nr:MAG: hypothetical protein AUG51_16715 [Acidobacteria bacterium 13_1_20CM_3_53_8]